MGSHRSILGLVHPPLDFLQAVRTTRTTYVEGACYVPDLLDAGSRYMLPHSSLAQSQKSACFGGAAVGSCCTPAFQLHDSSTLLGSSTNGQAIAGMARFRLDSGRFGSRLLSAGLGGGRLD